MHKRRVQIAKSLIVCSIAIIALLSGIVLNLFSTGTLRPPNVLATPYNSPFDYLLVIVMENHSNSDIIGSALYMSDLATNYSYAEGYTAVEHPSLPNYLALLGASTFGCAGYDGNPNSNSCTTTAWNAPSLVDRVESAGLTWKAYMESMPSNCYNSDSGNYAVRHDPFVYFKDITNNQSRCSHVVPAGSGDSNLLNDLGSTSKASNFMWLSPNLCHDMHDCSVSSGDSYLSQLVPQVLNSNVFTTQKAALFITFDEGTDNYPTDYVYSVWAGNVVKQMYASISPYSHYSFIKTVEDAWGLQSLGTKDSGASNMAEFFTSSFSAGSGYNGRFCLFQFCYSTITWLYITAGGLVLLSITVLGIARLRARSHRHRRHS